LRIARAFAIRAARVAPEDLWTAAYVENIVALDFDDHKYQLSNAIGLALSLCLRGAHGRRAQADRSDERFEHFHPPKIPRSISQLEANCADY
jgi:hypothetical protein